jgi:hypothetical protein
MGGEHLVRPLLIVRWRSDDVLRYPKSSPRALRRVGGRSRSLNGGRNRFSYGIVGISTRFNSEIMVLKSPWSWLGIPWLCPPCSPRGCIWDKKLKWRLSSICTDRYDADDLKKPHSFGRVVRMWCGICSNPVVRYFVNPEGLNYGDLLVGVVDEFTSWLMVWNWASKWQVRMWV